MQAEPRKKEEAGFFKQIAIVAGLFSYEEEVWGIQTPHT